ncbi:phage baseplate plug family protein [Cronobacter dublinensis]|uniref:phage baseplate plug family protein n=1 Tax=Cronobacter dublinensis TaxID=413497 RepID=UPI000CFBB95D|nr:hypothetical protein [Cronobacter dublinensis]EKY3223599.1 hypothetical protein [Cronobacter dublinensis]ELY9423065.1 hypothetical protein [Cronobacter dublinensis]MDI7383620.1 hypothetical protein [Cronobacter dublinensis]
MAMYEIPLTPDNQHFSIDLNGSTYQLRLIWRDGAWIMDIEDSAAQRLLAGLPLLPGEDLLAQHSHMAFGFALYVVSDDDMPPGKDTPGLTSHLYVLTEPL